MLSAAAVGTKAILAPIFTVADISVVPDTLIRLFLMPTQDAGASRLERTTSLVRRPSRCRNVVIPCRSSVVAPSDHRIVPEAFPIVGAVPAEQPTDRPTNERTNQPTTQPTNQRTESRNQSLCSSKQRSNY